MTVASEAKVIRLLAVQRKARLDERIRKNEYRSSMYLDRLSGASKEMELFIEQLDVYINGDLTIGREQEA